MIHTPLRLALVAIACFLATFHADAQIVWTEPAFPTQNDPVTLYYNSNLGSGGLVGVIPVYIHTGVITSASTGPGDWQHVQTSWGVADPVAVMNPVGNGIHSFHFGGQTLAQFYNLNAAISGLKQWVIMCREAERNPLF